MTKKNLINRFAEKKGFSFSTARKIVDMVFDDIAKTLTQSDRVEIRGLALMVFVNCGADSEA